MATTTKQLLLTPKDVAEHLGTSKTTLYRHKIIPRLLALGMKRVQVGGDWKYEARTLKKVIEKVASKEGSVNGESVPVKPAP